MRISLHKQYWQALVLECSGMFWNLHLQEGPRKHLRQPSYQASRSQALWQPSGDGGKVRSGQCHVWSTPAAQLQGFFRTGYVRSMVCTSLPQSTKLKTAFTAWSTSFNYYNTCSHLLPQHLSTKLPSIVRLQPRGAGSSSQSLSRLALEVIQSLGRLKCPEIGSFQ